MNLILSIFSGVLLALAFPKFNLYWLAWVALVPFFVALARTRNWKESMLCGFSFGIFFFGIHLFWVTTLFRFVEGWIILGWIALTLYQTLFILLFVTILYFIGNPKRVTYAVFVALLWTTVEWLRACGPFGVTGGDVGYSQAQMLPLIQIASLTSVYGVSFLVVLFNASALQFLMDKRKWLALALSLVLIIGCYGYGSLVMGQETGGGGRVKLGLLQPNIDQKHKLNPSMVQPVFDVHEEMTRQAMKEKPDIIIWPETAIFSYILHDPPLLRRMQKLARGSKAWLIFGTPHYVRDKAYNSIVSMSPTGKVVSRYDKQQLVPFGEYLPFRKILYPFLKGIGYYEAEFSSNPHPELIKAKDLKIAAAVCFESTFPDLIRKRAKKDSDFILLVTNDAWFGDSSALYLHLDSGIFRAIENRKYFIQVGNTGLTAVVDPYGRILKKTKVNQREVVTFELPIS